MATRFLNRDQLWQRLSSLAKATPNSLVVVAFCGVDAAKLLPLRRGSTLIVDASDATVKAGATSPAALAQFLRRGVRVYSVEHLHAKIFIFGRRVLVGSSNVSTNSARLLEEAAVETTDRTAIQDARAYIDSLEKDPLGPNEIRRLRRLYQKPRFAFTGAKLKRKRPPIWFVPLARGDWDPEDDRNADIERPNARKRMTSRAFDLHEFQWEGGRFLKAVVERQRVIQVLRISKSRTEVYRDGAVVGIRPYRKKGKSNAVVFLELRRSGSRTTLKQLRRRSSALARKLAGLRSPKADRSLETRRALKTIWPD